MLKNRILIVEDNKTLSLTLQHLVKKMDIDYVVVESLAEVTELLKKSSKFLTAIVDYNLPDANSGEAIDEVTEYKIAPIVVTASTDDKTRERILKRAVVDYVPKDSPQAFTYISKIINRLIKNQGIGVLVVDHQRSARNYLTYLLQRHKFNIYQAKDAEQALKQLKKHKNIKLVITEENMPGKSGIELTTEIRRDYGTDEVAIIGVSSEAKSSLSARFIKSGANDFIVRPFHHEELFCRINLNIEFLEQVEEINIRANTDFLTKMFNRRYFFAKAPKLIAEAKHSKKPLAVAMLDIDYFKSINDTHGHDAGDLIIQAVAEAIMKFFPEALSARFGGEEFCVLLPSTDLSMAKSLLEEFRQLSEDTQIAWDNDVIEYTVSIGISEFAENDIYTLITEADNNLYAAKQTGRNQVVG